MDTTTPFPMIRHVPYMGVIWVVHEASKLGFYNGHPDWCNLGQGQPEVGDLAGGPDRLTQLEILPEDQAYGPVGGTLEARAAVAEMYNRIYRRGMKSQYTAENVSIASGGRLALTRFFATLADETRVLYKTPDYTAYEDDLYAIRHRCTLIPLPATAQEHFSVPVERLERVVAGSNIRAFVFSNPCNPTGELIEGETLARYVRCARTHGMLLAADEFYSHYIYTDDDAPAQAPVSAARYVEDVEKDPVILFDGLTKNQRYPGWRNGWAIGPSHCIEMMNRAASAIDGGPSMLMQRLLLEALEPARFDQETQIVRKTFATKRAVMLDGLRRLGINPTRNPRGTFYVWASIANLPPPLNDADTFFHACLQHKVMTVPGRFFDVRPERQRLTPEPLQSWVRFSYGPSLPVVQTGIQRITQLLHV